MRQNVDQLRLRITAVIIIRAGYSGITLNKALPGECGYDFRHQPARNAGWLEGVSLTGARPGRCRQVRPSAADRQAVEEAEVHLCQVAVAAGRFCRAAAAVHLCREAVAHRL